MTPILQGLSGLVFLMTAESGIIIQNFDRQTGRTRDDVYDASVGYDIGFVGYNPTANYTISGRKNSGSGLGAAAPAVILTIAGTKFGNGVGTTALDAGGVYTNTVGLSHGERGFQSLSITAIQKPGIA